MVLGISGSDSPVHFPDPYNVWKISALLFWAFLGWENMSFGLGELQNPEKNVKRVFWLSFGLTIFIYLMLAATSIGADADGVPLSGASGLVELVKFTPPGNLLIWLMGVVIIANVTCWNFASSRLVYASGKEEVLSAFLGKISKRGQPMASILSMYIAFVLVLLVTCVFNISVSSLLMLVNQNFLFLTALFCSLTGRQKPAGGAGCIRVFPSFPFPSLSRALPGKFCILLLLQESGITVLSGKTQRRKKRKKKQLIQLIKACKTEPLNQFLLNL